MSYAQYAPIAIAAAQAYGIDPQIYLNQITQESNWNPNAVSPAGAQGINQFMPQTAAGMGLTNPFDPEASLYAGAALMAQNLQMFGGDYSLALAAYNAGPGAVQQYGGVPPYAETQTYVQKILGGSGGASMPEFSWPDLWPFNNDDEEGDERNPLDEYTWTPEERVAFLTSAGMTWVSGNGPDAIWRMPDGDTISEQNAFTRLLSGSGAVNVPSGSSATQPLTRSVGGTLYQYNPTTQQWTPVAGGGSTTSGFTLGAGQTRYGPNGEIIAQAPAGSSSGFTLSGGQTRYVPDGRGGYTAIQAPIESDPYAAIKLQQAQMDLMIKSQNLRFLQDKHAFEVEMGRNEDARRTQAQIFEQRFAIQKLETDIQQFNARMAFDVQQANITNERLRQQQLQGLATDIGQLAQDPGDRAAYASTVLANSGWGQDVQGDLRTQDSLMPLEALLRQRQDLMGGQSQVSVPPVSGINLGALQAPTANPAAMPGQMQLAPPQVSGMPDTTPGYDTGTGQPGIPYGGIALDPEEIMAGAQWAPTPGFEGSGINLAAMMGALPQQQPQAGGYTTLPLPPGGAQGSVQPLPSPDPANGRYMNLPLKAKGGMEDEAFIAGEAGPEIVIPHGDGKAVILNAEQAKIAGIDLSKLQKFADGGLFDGLIQDNDRGLATNFLNEAVTRAKAGTPWEGMPIPGPTFASSPGFDPIVAQLMASINAMETGMPAQAYLRNAALRRPAGVNEAPIRRSA